jgi:3-oxoacyl-[acyl-carrier-protein] synthase-3
MTAIHSLAVAVPKRVVRSADFPYPLEDFERTAGVIERRWAEPGQGYLHFALAAARELPLAGVDALLVVSQTGVYRLPGVALMIHKSLGLAESCPAFDLCLSCSGYVQGLWMADRLIRSGSRKVLLLAGDVTSLILDKGDRSTAPLFGDAVSATLVVEGETDWRFVLGTDGGGFEAIQCRAGGVLAMDGPEVFAFTLAKVPALVKELMQDRAADAYLLHQANAFMLKTLAKKCGIEKQRLPSNIGRYGNTSSASIPLLMTELELTTRRLALAMLGFGAGFAWAGMFAYVGPLEMCKVVEA